MEIARMELSPECQGTFLSRLTVLHKVMSSHHIVTTSGSTTRQLLLLVATLSHICILTNWYGQTTTTDSKCLSRAGEWLIKSSTAPILTEETLNKMEYTAKDPRPPPPPTAFSVPKRNVLYLRETKLWRCGRGRGGETCHLKTHAPLGGCVGKKTRSHHSERPTPPPPLRRFLFQ